MPIEIKARPTELYLVNETADMFEVSNATIRRWIKKEKLVAKKVGRNYRVSGSSILWFVKELNAATISN